MNVVYSKYVIFREYESSSKNKQVTREKEPKKLVFDLKNESPNSDGLTKSEEEVEV